MADKASADAAGSPLAQKELEMLAFWQREKVFEQSLQKHAPKGDFIFYDGPPFATGLPHTGSLLSSVIKDVVPRYKTMQGYRVPRRWGWDCHGLPIESLVEKKLDLKTKKDILNIGIDTFNESARSMVLQYVHDWERYVDRIGRWVDFKNSYKTMDNSYIESVWWALKELNTKGLLYEGRKVLMYCPHCETPLAKAEIAMDNTYRDIQEEAVTVKFKVKNPHKHHLPENTYLLAWTTTPWTLPGNVALAVGPEITYGLVERNGAHYLEAEDAGELKGKDLVGIEYEPLYEVAAVKAHSGKKHVVLPADFVTTGEGTGIVHTAVMYGEDDFALGQREKLPMVQLLEANGHYNAEAPEFIRGRYLKQAQNDIKQDLESRGLLYARGQHMHSYPHCYRCGTALIYNAVPSWFINIQKVKQKMLAANEQIQWFPEHLKHGRFRNILENAPDWTISRNRFWASPLPIWKQKGGKGLLVVGSLEELLAKTKKSGNRYLVMRHGEAISNLTSIFDSTGDPHNHLTDKGKEQAQAAGEALKGKGIDLIIHSPILRTTETAHLVQQALGLPDTAVSHDERLWEMRVGIYNGRKIKEWQDSFEAPMDQFDKAPEGGESLADVRKRVGDFLFDIESKYQGKTILIVTHECPARMLRSVANHASKQETGYKEVEHPFVRHAECKEVAFTPYPHNAKYELDLHRPYIDSVVLTEGGTEYERIPEVVDCWVESGAMPFASANYPRDKSLVNPAGFFGFGVKGYPADFIAEYIAQTRTWFYYMHAMGILLFNRSSFKAVVSTGNILAKDGSKMSKSKGNYTDPYELMEQWGADSLRLSLMDSVVMQGEDFNFRDEDVREANRTLSTLQNCLQFFELYKKDLSAGVRAEASPHVLDKWILLRLQNAASLMTEHMDGYDIPKVCTHINMFIKDYSVWYVRRSRDRMKGGGEDKQFCLATQAYVLETLAKLMAPITPFIAESIYRAVSSGGVSVHLTEWPQGRELGESDKKLLRDMAGVRSLASTGLQLREKAGIKVRQPLSRMSIKESLPPELQQILADEVNVKEVVINTEMEGTTELTTELTPELREEGALREWVRTIQEWRKGEKLSVADRPGLLVHTPEAEFIRRHREALMEATGLMSLETKEGELKLERL